jgi:formylglycine-generating enzyme required for sulfatase activity
MKENIIHNGDQLFEGMLRQYLLANQDHPFNQKTVNMTAEIIFGLPPMKQPSRHKGSKLLSRLCNDFKIQNNLLSGWNRLLLLLLLASVGVIYFWHPFQPKTSMYVPVSTRDIKNNLEPVQKRELPVLKELKFSGSNPRIHVSVLDSDNVHSLKYQVKDSVNIKSPLKDKRSVAPEMGYTPLAGNPEPLKRDYDWSGFDIKWTPDLKNFVKKQIHFNTDSISMYYRVKHSDIVHDYFEAAPFKKTPDDLIYINYADQLQHVKNPKEKVYNIPMASRFYLDSQFTNVEWYWIYKTESMPEAVLHQSLMPFYFRKYEVTNGEYKEFLRWLAKQNGYPDYHSALKSQDDINKAFTYQFNDLRVPALKGIPLPFVNVFPDTLAIVEDFWFSKDDEMAKNYFGSSRYDKHPVCGVNYWQAMAYLDWKTKIYQDYLDREKIPYKVSFELPTDIEWEMAAALSDKDEKTNLVHYNYIFDDNWITSLAFSGKNGVERFHALDHMLLSDVIVQGNWILDGYLYPGPADLRKYEREIKAPPASLHLLPSGISWMDCNVSEWMQETYKDNWLPMFKKHQDFLMKTGKDDDKILAMTESFFDKRNDPDGHLVRGGNWYDERYSDIGGKNLAGIMLKRFVSPSKSYSTIGFRYVVRVERK